VEGDLDMMMIDRDRWSDGYRSQAGGRGHEVKK
jgi:hypothetical protein